MPKRKIENIAYGVNTPLSSCKVFDSDRVLFASEEIDYYKTCIKEFEASNKLLGEINDEGEYVINEKIRRDLALIPKEHTNTEYNRVEAYSRLLAKDLYFYIEIQENENEQIASLYLIEKVSGYRDLQSLTSFIAKVVQPKANGFVDKVKRVFNIQDVITKIDEGKFIKLTLQIQNRIDYWFEMEDIMDLSSQIYVLRMLSFLEDEGDLGRKTLEEYNRKIKFEGLDNAKIKGRFLKLRKYLDEAIDKFGGKEIVFKKHPEEVKSVKSEYSSPIKKVEDIRKRQANKPVVKKIEPAPAKVESSKASSKPKAKTAGKKADKKADKQKKKDDKKKDEKKDDGKKKGGGGPSKSEIKSEKPVAPASKTGNSNQYTPASFRNSGRIISSQSDDASDEETTRLFGMLGAPRAHVDKDKGEVNVNAETPKQNQPDVNQPLPTNTPSSPPPEAELP